MKKAFFRIVTLVSALVTFTLQKIVIPTYKQQIVLMDQVPIVNVAMVIKNDGTSNIQDFQLIFPTEKVKLIGQIDAEDGFGNPLTYEMTDSQMNIDVKGAQKEFTFFNFALGEPLGPTREITINMRIYYYGKYEFLPAHTDLFDDQKVVFYAQIVPTVPYTIVDLETTVRTSDSNNSFNVEKENIPPYSFEEKRFHFVMNNQFLQMRSSERNVEISHWGNVYFSEKYDMMNRCAPFKGEFSTLDFNRGNRDKAGRNAFRISEIELPFSAWGFDFRDEIGNITTSIARRDDYKGKALVTLTPRFGLLGHWNATWFIGYNVPAENILKMSRSENKYVFEYPLSHLIKEGISDEFTTKIALPEGATIVEVHTGGNKAEVTFDKTFSYLDFFGRPTVVVKMKNHIPDAVEGNLKITYKFSKVYLLIEPLYIGAGIFGMFLISIVIGRMNLDFKKEQKEFIIQMLCWRILYQSKQ